MEADKVCGYHPFCTCSHCWRQQIFNCILWALLLYLLERLFIFKLAAFCATASGCHRVSTFFLFLPRPATNAMLSDDYNKKQRSERKRKENNTLLLLNAHRTALREVKKKKKKKTRTTRRAKAGGPDVSRSQTSLINLQGCNNFIRECPATPSVAATNALRRIFGEKMAFRSHTHRWRCTRALQYTTREIYRQRVCVTACRPQAKASDDNTRY